MQCSVGLKHNVSTIFDHFVLTHGPICGLDDSNESSQATFGPTIGCTNPQLVRLETSLIMSWDRAKVKRSLSSIDHKNSASRTATCGGGEVRFSVKICDAVYVVRLSVQ